MATYLYEPATSIKRGDVLPEVSRHAVTLNRREHTMSTMHALTDHGSCICGYSGTRPRVLEHIMSAWSEEDATD